MAPFPNVSVPDQHALSNVQSILRVERWHWERDLRLTGRGNQVPQERRTQTDWSRQSSHAGIVCATDIRKCSPKESAVSGGLPDKSLGDGLPPIFQETRPTTRSNARG